MRLFLIVVLIPNIFFSQINSGSIQYKITLIDDEAYQKSEIGQMYESVKSMNDVTFNLDFNASEMIFYRNRTMAIDNQNLDLFLAFSNLDDLYYKSKNNHDIIRTIDDENLGKLIIYSKQNLVWHATNESKKIGDFVCYKATSSYTINNGEYGVFTYPIIAWFCPSIPYSYGPKGYGGLPGVILELQERNVLFGAMTLNLVKEEIKIKIPTGGKILKEEEYIKLLEEINK